MAIDDNTSYELTGAQVKDLASKINVKADTSSLATVATSGSYADLSNKPTIPTVNDGTLTIQQNGTTVGTFTANQSTAATVSLTDTTYSAMTGATSSTAGASGLVPAPAAGDEAKVLSGAGTWVNQSGGGGGSSVTYYATSDNTQGFPTYYTYLYSDTARTTVVTPDTILSNFENGDTVLIEYKSTQTGSSAYKMTLAVESVAKVGTDGYRMNASEISIASGGYNQVETQFMATWDGQSPFSGMWVLVRNQMPVVNNGTLTIRQNGTTKGTFTANQSTTSTVNIETIYADTISPATAVDPITTSMIADGAVTAAKTAFGGNYSTTEVDTGFTWIDGKHIYKKSVDFGWLPNSTTKNVNHGISNFGRLIKAEATAAASGNWAMMPLVFQGDSSNYNVEFQITSTDIHMSANTDRSSWRDCIVTLWYTKTS